MKRAFSVTAAAVIAAFPLLGSGCASPPPAAAPDAQALIGGIPADAPSLDAIGALVMIDTLVDCARNELTTRLTPVCTATLIAPQTIVTAKHCVSRLAGRQTPDSLAYFLIGPDRAHPKRRIPVLDWHGAPTFDGGWAKNGRDVAVVALAERVTDVVPVRIATPTDGLRGKRLAAVGFGARNEQEQGGLRTMGNVTFNTLGGKAYEAMFGDYESFRTWYLEGEPSPADDEVTEPAVSEAELHATYDGMQLLTDYEAHAGARPGDVQPCFGDSGGPLLDIIDGALVSYGVSSGGVASQRSICDFGSVYATFGPDTRALIEQTAAFADPCDGLSTMGVCEDSVARRCTGANEGPRRLIVSDCATLGQTCAQRPGGSVHCAGIGAIPAAPSQTALPQCGGLN